MKKKTAKKAAGIVVDLGNTSLRMALYMDGKIVERYDRVKQKDEIREHVVQTFISKVEHYKKIAVINGIAIASVANPSHTDSAIKFFQTYFQGLPVRVISGDMKGLSVKLARGFTQKKKIGADRLANAMAAVALGKHPCVIADFGTALTVDGVNERGEFVGGMILPGMTTLLRAMHDYTAQLPELDLPPKPFEKPFGQNTKDAMLAGVEHGYRGLACGAVATLQNALGGKCTLLATGGMAKRVATTSGLNFEINPDLTLLGIAQVLHTGVSS